jgi:nitrogenase-associated protein
MVQVVFYAKPGCRGNARQVRVLKSSGHEVLVRDLFAEPWSAAELRSYFGDRPVADWFNRSAVRVKNGEIVPERLSDREAMALLLADHGLIRRPLMQAAGERHAGWEPDLIARWIGLGTSLSPGKEACAQGAKKHQTPEGALCDAHRLEKRTAE